MPLKKYFIIILILTIFIVLTFFGKPSNAYCIHYTTYKNHLPFKQILTFMLSCFMTKTKLNI
jgi:hypothetical protein